MKILTTKEKILWGISIVERVTGKKETLPVLSCVLFDVGKEIYIRATNLESAVSVVIPGDITEKGTMAVPAHILSQTIRSISGDKVTLSLEDGNLLIESRGSKTLIKAVPHEEFPSFPVSDGGKKISLSREQLVHGMQSVSYAASPSMIRPDLGSVYVSVADGLLTCVATDSFRLAEKIVSGTGSKASEEILIPLRHAAELTHILEHLEDEKVELSADEAQLLVKASGVQFISRVVDSAFPNYKEILPKKFTTEATLLKNDFADMLRKARVFSGSDMHVGLHVYPKKKICTATARSAEVGEMSDSIDAALSGEDLDINFHIGYLSDCLSSIPSDSLVLGFSGPARPLVIRGVGAPDYTYLVMPLNR